MSGPKGGDYYVVETAEQIEARLLRDAKAQYARASSGWDAVGSRVAALREQTGSAPACVRPAAVADGADSADWAQAARELEQASADVAAAVSALREQSAEKSHAEQVARIMARIAAHPQTPAAPARTPKWQEQSVPEPVATIDWSRVKDRVERRIGELAALDHDGARAQALLADISAAGTSSRIDLLIGELDFVIAEARTAATRRAAVDAARGELLALQARIDGLTGAQPEKLRSEIRALIRTGATEVPAPLSVAVDAAFAGAEAAADRRHVVEVMQLALGELGYSVGPTFSTDLSGAQGVAFARNGSSNYGIKVRLEPGSARFTTQAVKSDAALTSAEEDVSAERSFCEDFHDMVGIAQREGVRLGIDIRTEAGAYAVQPVADAKLGRAAARARRATTGRESEQPR